MPVSVSQLKQIAGRAGRRNSAWGEGLATCRMRADVPSLKAALAVPLADMSTPHAGLFPEFEHLEVRPSSETSLMDAPCRVMHHSIVHQGVGLRI